VPREVAVSLVAALALSACGSTTRSEPPVASAFVPDVPSWRGGCFFDGPSGKIVNASPSPDVRLFGGACSTPASPGGIVFLDHHDPVTGTGDVAVLSADPGSVPVLVGPHGGAGGIIPGGTGARFNDAQTFLLTLSDVSYVTGRLVLVDLPRATSPRILADGVRVENYDFLPGDGVVFVGDYSATSRTGSLYYWPGTGSPELVAGPIARFDFNMYRLSPDRARVAYLTSFTSVDGGSLAVQTLPPGSGATPIDTGVVDLSWTPDGQHLVYLVQEEGAPTYSLRIWDEGASPRTVADGVSRVVLAGDQILYLTGWSILTQRGALHRRGITDGADSLTAVDATRAYAALALQGTAGVLAFTVLPSASEPSAVGLYLTSLTDSGDGSPGQPVDTGISPAAGFSFSPAGGFAVYAKGFEQPQAAGSANPQPGIAGEVWAAPSAGVGAPFLLASEGSFQWFAWDPDESLVGALSDFAPALGSGTLVVRDTAGHPLFSQLRVGATHFDFGDDGAVLAFLREWDDALQRGELAATSTTGPRAWQAETIDRDVTFYLQARGERIVYGVRGGGRDGLWLGALPR
jgi:hypothetical protein